MLVCKYSWCKLMLMLNFSCIDHMYYRFQNCLSQVFLKMNTTFGTMIPTVLSKVMGKVV